TVLVLGLAYKRNAGDARESPSVALIHRLLADGAEGAVADPQGVEEVPTDRLTRRVELTEAELERADAVVLVTDHDAFDYELVTKHARLVLDTRHRLGGPRGGQREGTLERPAAVVLLTDADAFDYELVTKHARLVLDTRHRLDGPRVEQL